MSAALRPVTGADKVARFLVAVAAQGMALPDVAVEIAEVTSLPGVLVRTAGRPELVLQLVVTEGRVEQVLLVRNPDKLRGLSVGSAG